MINETDKIEAYQFENRLHELPNKPERIWEHAGVKASNNDWNQIISRKDEKERWKVGKKERIERSKNLGGRDKRSTKWRESTIWIWKASVQPSFPPPIASL